MSETIGPIDASKVPRYAGIATFARLPRLDQVESADVAIVGIHFDSGVSYRPGARFGPSHVRESSRLLRPYNPATDIEPFAQQQVADAGDIPVNPFIIEEAIGTIEVEASKLLATGAKLMTIGGDHTIALPLLRALHAIHGPIAVVHFDAHLDTWDTYFGVETTHGTPFRRASEEGLIDMTIKREEKEKGAPLSDVRKDQIRAKITAMAPQEETLSKKKVKARFRTD